MCPFLRRLFCLMRQPPYRISKKSQFILFYLKLISMTIIVACVNQND